MRHRFSRIDLRLSAALMIVMVGIALRAPAFEPTPPRAPDIYRSSSYACICPRPLILPSIEFTDLTLPEFVERLRTKIQSYNTIDRSKPNIVIDYTRLTPDQLSARISMKEEAHITYFEVLYSVCKALGIGCRVDDHAVLISSRAKVGLPDPPSPRTSRVPDGHNMACLLFIAKGEGAPPRR